MMFSVSIVTLCHVVLVYIARAGCVYIAKESTSFIPLVFSVSFVTRYDDCLLSENSRDEHLYGL